jgi:NADPH-dependent ferric siderophore reductase
VTSGTEAVRQFIGRLLERLVPVRRSGLHGLRVIATRHVTPHMLRVTFEGSGLEPFATDENLHVRLYLPPQGVSRGNWLIIDQSSRARLRDETVKPVLRKYTLRTIDPAARRVEIDFVLHGDSGPASTWAMNAQPGDVVAMIGPGGRGIRSAEWLLIAGDETALPAIGRILERLPESARGVVLVEVAGSEEEQALHMPASMQVRWLHRGSAAPGTTTLLREAIEVIAWPTDGRSVFAWVGAETASAQRIRTYLRKVRRLDKSEHMAVAYWQRDPGGADGHMPARQPST